MRREGDLFKLYLLLFGVSRFVIEFYREGSTFFLGLTAMQWFCMELFVFASASFIITARRKTGGERWEMS